MEILREIRTEISVDECIAKYASAVKSIKSSRNKTYDYLVSSGIYTPTGRLKKIYLNML